MLLGAGPVVGRDGHVGVGRERTVSLVEDEGGGPRPHLAGNAAAGEGIGQRAEVVAGDWRERGRV